MPELRDAIVIIGVPGLNGGGVTAGQLATAVADTAPKTATYITQTANATLTAEQALSSLSTGIVKVTTGTGVLSTATGADLPSHNHTGVVYTKQMVIDGGGATITTGIKGDFVIEVSSTITAWHLYANQTGSIQIDLWNESYLNFPPTDADSITGSEPVAMTTNDHFAGTGTGIDSWDLSVSAGDIIRVNVDSVTSIQRVTLVLWLTRSI